jgi:hypothetical protein
MFDPYHKWLGISPKDQPPNHYRLLGVDLFESDADVIDAAANRQMAYLHGCATGGQVALSQQLLNEVATARLCLLDPDKKTRYDALLERRWLEEDPKQRPGSGRGAFQQLPVHRNQLRASVRHASSPWVLGTARLGLPLVLVALGLLTLCATGAVWWALRGGGLRGPGPADLTNKGARDTRPARPDRWTVLFRADDPALWNTDTHKGDQFAVSLGKAPDGIRYVRLRRMDTGEALIVPITQGSLSTDRLPPPEQEGAWWNGTAKKEWAGRHLGIAEVPRYRWPNHAGMISIMDDGSDLYSGSGFGHKAAWTIDKQYYAWRGKEIPRTVFEIAVTAEPLTDAEKRILILRL